MNKDLIRIEKMKEERALLLKKVRESIQENGGHLSESIDQVITVLDFDDKSVKKYEAMVQARELIAKLTQEVVEAKTSDEVFEIRKRLNYYINKIKEEMKKRKLDSDICSEYQEKVSSFRKDIAKYIRFLKRDNTLFEIEKYYANFEQLTEDDLKLYKKLLKRELEYNRRNLVEQKQKKEKSPVCEEQVEVSSDEGVDLSNTEEVMKDVSSTVETNPDDCESFDFSFLESDRKDSKKEDLDFSFDFGDEPSSSEVEPLSFDFMSEEHSSKDVLPKSLNNVQFEDVSDFLNRRVSRFNQQYNVIPTLDYRRHSLGKNIVHFFRNLPRYIHNKKSIGMMMRDYSIFYRGSDLESYIEYMRRRNSIKQGLKCIFQRSHLYSRDNRYLNRHDKCSEWLFNFCKRNSMEIPYEMEKCIL